MKILMSSLSITSYMCVYMSYLGYHYSIINIEKMQGTWSLVIESLDIKVYIT